MRGINRWMFITAILTGLWLTGCAPKEVTTGQTMPSKLEPIAGTDLSKVILTQKAADRIGIETVPASGTSVPYSAVIYDVEGNAWIYTNPEPLVFVRESISIDHIEGETAVLARSLPSELNVVTVGVIELYGTETGVSK